MADGLLVPGVRVGHWTSRAGNTGTTVVLPDRPAVAAVDVRGNAPATRETDALAPWRLVERADAVVLSGGSGLGLGTAHTVAVALAEAGRGYPTSGGPVPIVPAACVFDLVASGGEHPPPDAGRAALANASSGPAWGRVGAGAGARVGSYRGHEWASPGGIGAAREDTAGCGVCAVAVVNAFGDVVEDDGTVLAGCRADGSATTNPFTSGPPPGPLNTTLVAVATTLALDPAQAHALAIAAQDGIARSVRPSHTRYDGDVVFVLAVPGDREETASRDGVDAAVHVVGEVVAGAVRHAVSSATLSGPGHR